MSDADNSLPRTSFDNQPPSGPWGSAVNRMQGQASQANGQSKCGDSGVEIHKRVELAAEIFSKYSSEIRSMIGFNVKDKSRADDVFQDLFVSLVHNPIPSDVNDIKAYLYRAITNDVIDVFRRTKIHQVSVERYAETHRYDVAREDPQDRAIEAEETRKMFQLIENLLPKRQATAFVHRCANSLSTSDTAERMSVDKRSIHHYLAAAKKKMRDFGPENEGNSR